MLFRSRIIALETAAILATEAVEKAKSLATRHDAQVKELEGANAALDVQVRDERKKRLALEAEQLGSKVTQLCREAIRAGVAPAIVEGYEKDPVGWFKASFTNLEALQTLLKALPKTASLSRVRSSPEPSDTDTESLMEKDRVDNLRNLGLNPAFALAENANDLARLREKKQENAKK